MSIEIVFQLSMSFLPYPSIPPAFSYYSAWIPLERSLGYSYSFQSIGVDRAAFHVVLFQYSPAFLALLSVDIARGLILLLFFLKSIGVNQKCLLYFNYPLSIPPPFLYYSAWIPSRIFYSYSFKNWSHQMHIPYSKTEMIL